MTQDQEPVTSPHSTRSSDSKNNSFVKEETHPNGGDSASDEDQMAAAKDRDPNRPKRRKAKKACAACQRAHLTCSDLRPCERCLKRNIADDCHDGPRKTPKYMADAPTEALVASHGPAAAFAHLNGFQHVHHGQVQPSPDLKPSAAYNSGPTESSQAGLQAFQSNKSNYGMPPPSIDTQGVALAHGYQSPASSTFSSSQTSPMQHYGPAANGPNSTMSMSAQIPDVADPTTFNFDLTGMNFGNHYGALEFGMLEHMSTNPQANATSGNLHVGGEELAQNTYSTSQYPSQSFSVPVQQGWEPSHRPQLQPFANNYDASFDNLSFRQVKQETVPHAFAIGSGSRGSFSSSSAASSVEPSRSRNISRPSNDHYPKKQDRFDWKQSSRPSVGFATHTATPCQSAADVKQSSAYRADAASVYETSSAPYPYTEAFHRLFRLLRYRFPQNKLARIAKAFGKIRPSFILSTSSLIKQDLIFMEQIFQRSMVEYEGILDKVGVPTLVCRRTGEVAKTNLGFQMLVGWDPEVLLGHKPNLNANKSSVSTQSLAALSGYTPTGTGKGGLNTPNVSSTPVEPGVGVKPVEEQQVKGGKKPQPVFLAELLDEDSVVQFYEDFSQLAFADRKGRASARCNLLQYRTKTSETGQTHGKPMSRKRKATVKNEDRTPKVESQEGLKQLGGKDGRVNCTYCWEVKRDVFNMPSLIVINTFPYILQIDAIVASPLRRTIYTALQSFPDVIERRHIRIITLPELQETSDLPCDVGSSVEELKKEFAGKPVSFDLLQPDWNSKKGRWAPEAHAIQERARVARNWLRSRPKKHIVAVTHGGLLHYLTEDWQGMDKLQGQSDGFMISLHSSEDAG
ncbi:MAG: hypothetical protein Q9162_000589 [Coniocarpon cinnabarinum]